MYRRILHGVQSVRPNSLAILLMLIIFLARSPFLRGVSNPYNDGGLFLPVIEDLIQEGVFTQKFINYNNYTIPFVYPPLGIYVVSLLKFITGFDTLVFFTVIPFSLSLICCLLYFYFVLELTKSKNVAFFSTLIMFVLPENYFWTIRGGGITRTWGSLFALSTLFFLMRWKKTGGYNYLLSGLMLGLTYLSHPDISFFITYSVIILYFTTNNENRGISKLFILLSIGIITSSFWWINVLRQHGTTPFASAILFRSGFRYPLSSLMFFTSADSIHRLVVLSGFAGIFYVLKNKKYLSLLLLLAVTLGLKQTVGFMYYLVPFSVFAGIGIDYIGKQVIKKKYQTVFFGVILLISLISFPPTNRTIRNDYPQLRPEDKNAMLWIRDHTPQNASFIVISPYTEWWKDTIAEWFPALARRKSIVTVQGTEWLPDNIAFKTVTLHRDTRLCNSQSLECLELAAQTHGKTFTHIFLSKMRDQPGVGDYCPLLFQSIRASERYRTIFGNESAEIWEKIQ